ncbi:MAG: SDR family oxidoreductase [Candidatus Nanopelagicales bacterium]|jgi:NAD(P)-dependent dehydrogenase (short-subunit alcohol dehydrogenase family)|nr:SDR family oxidoreductase [Candidatus Nanopelagicales bacterium]MDP4715794.1 SDR family oxidoreductase [Candidatus Nanopelagicales bacterium]MDP4907700.1 SDR family oxidoreductase [Candidatus Nanopelagicales bacterium]MDP4975693.1 SDR family oxidoreductase [Candidatus Nanopelagicales bacterium]MDP5095192.1 SDR family oxidoreductase [Candidatus Nanopelagicales bacterium]
MWGLTLGTALVTGVASGMGQATAAMFLERGWRVIGLDSCPDAGLDHPHLTPVTVDVRDGAAVTDAIAGAMSEVATGLIDAVVNVAGVYPPTTLATYTDDDFRVIFDVNVLGILHVTRASVDHMGPGSAIVNFASVDAFTVSPGQLLYGASKAAVVMLTKALALELAPRRIRVNGIAPGWVDTPGNAATGRMAEAAATIPLGRVAQSAEIAEWVWILTGSGQAGFVDGETIVISGADVMR